MTSQKKENRFHEKVWKRFVTGKITNNQVRQIYGLQPINDPSADMLLVRKSNHIPKRRRIRKIIK